MSKFNSYAKRVDELARKAFEEYEAAAAELEKAKTAQSAFPQRLGRSMDAMKEAKRAHAQADFLEAQEKMRQTKNKMDSYNDTVAAIRRELAAAVDVAFVASADQVDAAALELMKSGICGAADYEKLMHDATSTSNATMIRLVASFAAKAAEGLLEKDGRVSYDQRAEWSRLNAVGQQGAGYTSSVTLQKFDVLADAFKRAMRNPALIGKWDELTGAIVESF